MINQEYLEYWQQTIIDITLLSNLIKENIESFQQTHDIQHIEYILENIKEIIRLIPLEKIYYERINHSD